MTIVSRPRSLAAGLARWIIQRSDGTRFAGGGGFSTESFAARGDARPFPQAESERDGFDELFRFFPALDLRAQIAGRDVLDLGSGYGGKTVEYKRTCGARSVSGTEPHPRMIDLSRQYAASEHVDVEFTVCTQDELPYATESFDVVISHDVLEHVADPRITIREIHRVLRRGGLSVNLFPVYFGAKSHHLDYVSVMPALHWFFSPHVLVQAVNDVLAENPSKYGTAPQPQPRLSFDGARYVLPGLNGLSGSHFATLFKDFEIVGLRRIAMGPRGMGLVVNSALPAMLRDLATATVACALRKV